MFYQIFLSLQMKQGTSNSNNSNQNSVNELPEELPNHLRLRTLEN